MLTTIIERYKCIIEENQRELSRIQKQIYRIGTTRLLLFIIGVAGAIYFRNNGWTVVIPLILACLIPFMILIKVHSRLFYKKDFIQKLLKINENELAAINYQTDTFDSGIEFEDQTHAYSHDLDVFLSLIHI